MNLYEAELEDIKALEGKLEAFYGELKTKYPKLKEVVILGGYGNGVFCISPNQTVEQITVFVNVMAGAMKEVKVREGAESYMVIDTTKESN